MWTHTGTGRTSAVGPGQPHGGWTFDGRQWCHPGNNSGYAGGCVAGTATSDHGGWTYAAQAAYNLVNGGNQRFIGGLLRKGAEIGGEILKGALPGPVDDWVIDRAIGALPGGGGSGGSGPCRAGSVLIAGRCVAPGAALPGGEPLISRPTGNGSSSHAAEGISVFGLYTSPQVETVQRRVCPDGTVLGKDGLCYSKISNSHRMYPKKAKPPISAADMKAIRRAERAQNRVKRLTKQVGLRPVTRKRK